MNPSTTQRPRLPTALAGGREVLEMVPGQAPVLVDGQCLLPAGTEPLHGPFLPDACEAMRFSASHIEPIEDAT